MRAFCLQARFINKSGDPKKSKKKENRGREGEEEEEEEEEKTEKETNRKGQGSVVNTAQILLRVWLGRKPERIQGGVLFSFFCLPLSFYGVVFPGSVSVPTEVVNEGNSWIGMGWDGMGKTNKSQCQCQCQMPNAKCQMPNAKCQMPACNKYANCQQHLYLHHTGHPGQINYWQNKCEMMKNWLSAPAQPKRSKNWKCGTSESGFWAINWSK